MKSGRSFLNVVIICSVIVLQGWLAAQTAGVEPNAAGAQKTPNPPSTQVEPNQGTPIISFEQTSHDFGAVSPGSTNTCEFKFSNKGAGVLKITDVSKTCGCTVFTLDKYDYAPGGAGVIKVQFNADKGTGVRTRYLYVSSNDPNNPRAALTITATLTQKIVYEPERLDYTLKGEKAGAAELTIRSINEQPFAITKFESTSDAVTADFDPNHKAAKIVLQTKIDVKKMGPSNNGRIEITVTEPNSPSLTVPFSILPRFKVDPPAINVLNAELGKEVKRELWLLNNYNEDFDVNSATSKDGVIKVESREKLGNRYKFSLVITPPPVPGASKIFTDTLTIDTNDGEKINVACRGFYQRK